MMRGISGWEAVHCGNSLYRYWRDSAVVGRVANEERPETVPATAIPAGSPGRGDDLFGLADGWLDGLSFTEGTVFPQPIRSCLTGLLPLGPNIHAL